MLKNYVFGVHLPLDKGASSKDCFRHKCIWGGMRLSVIHLGTDKGQMGASANVLHKTSQGHKANISLFQSNKSGRYSVSVI